jgi:uncharacterized protein (DUF1501 family)
MKPLYSVFDEGRLAIVQAVGSDNTTGSHFEAQDQMEHGEGAGERLGGGWLGRYIRARGSNPFSALSAVTIGPTISESLRGATSANAIRGVDEIQINVPSADSSGVAQALATLYSAEVGFLNQPGRSTLDLLNRTEALRGRSYWPESGAEYPDTEFGRGLREIARLIKADLGLEVACIDLGGWDTHFFQGSIGGLLANVISELSHALAAFDADIERHHNRVTTLVMTEFGRRIYENVSLGTDHGRGFALLAIGGEKINGGRIIGDWSGLVNDDSEGPGGLRIDYDYRSVLAELLTGVMSLNDVSAVFPGLEPAPIGLIA